MPSRGGARPRPGALVGECPVGGASCSVLGMGWEGVLVKTPGCPCTSGCAADAVPWDGKSLGTLGGRKAGCSPF